MQRKTHIPTVTAHTFGCKVNFCDTNALLQALFAAGCKSPPGGSPPDVEILNTCAVTTRSVQKARRLIRHLRAANPQALIVVTGCAARMDQIPFHAMPEIDIISPSLNHAAMHICRRYGLPTATPRAAFDDQRTRAFLKVQEGCNAFCSYCIVPLVRGKPHSIPEAEVLRQFNTALERGFREIVLSGTNLGRYGRDLPAASLPALLAGLLRSEGDFRIRLSSIEPLEVSDELLDVMGSSKKVCPHLHVPLQSGSNRILKAMNRPYSAEGFLDVVTRARSALNNPAITTDIMVGFPGETPEDHRDSLETATAARFARGHVFVFSPRPGTVAEHLRPRLHGSRARERSLEMRSLCTQTAAAFRRGLLEKTVQVLPETAKNGFVEGFCSRYQRVRIAGGEELVGELVTACIMKAEEVGRQPLLQARLGQRS